MTRYQVEPLLAYAGMVLIISGVVGVLLLLFATAMIQQDISRSRSERIAQDIQWIKEHSK